MDTTFKGQWVKAIKVNGVPADTMGQIQFSDEIGRFYVAWENGRMGVIRERGDIYQFAYDYVPKKNIWNIKNLILILRKKIKQFYYGK